MPQCREGRDESWYSKTVVHVMFHANPTLKIRSSWYVAALSKPVDDRPVMRSRRRLSDYIHTAPSR